MEIVELIKHPENLDRDTLYELRELLALYPYFQTARILMLKNLYLLHDPSFDEELRRAAIYITDRKVLFQMIEAGHYQLRTLRKENDDTNTRASKTIQERDSRTLSLIDGFLDSLPKETKQENREKRKPTPVDAALDYVAYLLESENENDRQDAAEVPQLIGQELIDTFLEHDKGKLVLNENPVLKPDLGTNANEGEKEGAEDYYTEPLARIYIKQGNYLKALEIIQRLSLDNPKKSVYFADQIRFIKKLIINNTKK